MTYPFQVCHTAWPAKSGLDSRVAPHSQRVTGHLLQKHRPSPFRDIKEPRMALTLPYPVRTYAKEAPVRNEWT
jgi:hypothetical protein